MVLTTLMTMLSLYDVTLARLSVVTQTNSELHLTNCIVNISKTYFQPHRLLGINTELDHVHEQFHHLSIWPITQQQGTVQVKPQSYVWLMRNTNDLSQHIQHGGRSWNSRAKYLVVLTDVPGARSNSTEQRESARVVLQHLWTMKAVNVIVLTSSADKSWDAYTWFPYRGPDYCAGHDVQHVVLVDRWSWQEGRFTKNADLYPNKIPNDLQGCDVTITTFDWPPFIVDISPPNNTNISLLNYDGLEIRMLNSLANACNFTIVYLPPSKYRWGELLKNGTWSGSFGELWSERAQVMVGSLIKSPIKIALFDNTDFYVTNAVVWFAPRSKPIPRWKSLTKIFTPGFWTLLCATFILASFLFWIMGNMPRSGARSRDPDAYTIMAACVSNALAVLLGVSVYRQPRTLSLRFFFLLWAFYCLQINTAYQSALSSLLTEPGYEKQITTEEDLYDSELHLEYAYGYNIYVDADNTAEKKLLTRAKLCKDNIDCLKRASYIGNVAILSDKAYVNFLIPALFVDSIGRPLIKPFPANLISYYVGMMLYKGNILLERFNVLIRRIHEAGLMFKWRYEVERLSKTKYVSQVKLEARSSGPMAFTMSHLQGAYIVLIGGIGTSLVVFFGEIIVFKLRLFDVRSILRHYFKMYNK